MAKKHKTLMDVLKEKVPDIKPQKFNLVIEHKHLIDHPPEWDEFVMITVKQQTSDVSNNFLVMLDDKETNLVFDILKNKKIHLYVLGHPKSEQMLIWEVLAIKNDEGNVTFIGGENFRIFCDFHNLYYRSGIDKGTLLSGSTCQYLKKEGEDCRIPMILC
jgi:hypothetical protein